MAVNIGKGGTVVAVFTVLVLLLRFGIEDFGIDHRAWSSSDDWGKILEFFIIGITVLVVAVPEGRATIIVFILSLTPCFRPAAGCGYCAGVLGEEDAEGPEPCAHSRRVRDDGQRYDHLLGQDGYAHAEPHDRYPGVHLGHRLQRSRRRQGPARERYHAPYAGMLFGCGFLSVLQRLI
jgi:hypothetical protein